MLFAKNAPLFRVVPAAVVFAALLQHGCSDKETTSTTTILTDDSEPLFDGTSGQTDRSPWALPPFAINLHEETRTTAWTINAIVGTDARPGGLSQGQLVSGSMESLVSGQVVNELIPTGSRPKVLHSLIGFMGGDSARSICRGTNNVLYNDYLPPNIAARLFLPKDITVGTTWTSDMDQSGIAGKAFAYRSVGSISYRPTIATVDVGVLPGTDPYADSGIMAADTDGDPTIDAEDAAITYQIGTGYSGTWLDVRRSGRFEILAENTTTPDSQFTGCLRVALHFSYSLVGGLPTNATTVIGLDQFSGGYTLYWKPGIGWVHWSGSETTPQWGYQGLTSPSMGLNGTYDLSIYNYQYDSALFTSFPSSNLAYAYVVGWRAGFVAGYRDVSYPDFQEGERQSSQAALNTYLQESNLTDAIVTSSPNASVRAERAARQPAFLAGYAVGAAYYDNDYTAIPDDYDTLAPDEENRSNLSLHPNQAPAQFRADQALVIDSFGCLNLLAGFTDTGAAYTHGYDGMGIQVDAYDSTVTANPLLIRIKQDTSGNYLRGIYISLPVMGSVTTRTIEGATTQTGVVSNNG